MGKTKQSKEKKFDRNVEISAPILDPEIIKAIHSPPRGKRIDITHGGFKALLSDLNSQDSTDELAPLNDNHVPSYIGISCAVSGYANYSSYSKKPSAQAASKTNVVSGPNRSRTTSPVFQRTEHHVNHIKIDRDNIQSADDERKELTEKLTASATERRRSPSPCIPPTGDDRHHGAYVGARYCPLPPPSNVVNRHIPLLGIDDDKDPDEIIQEENKVEKNIASLYGEEFVEDWRESMTHKAKKEQSQAEQETPKNPKDLVTLKPTPAKAKIDDLDHQLDDDVAVPNAKVLANVEKQFLNKLLTDKNPPMPPQSPSTSTAAKSIEKIDSPPISPVAQAGQQSPPMSPDSGKSQSLGEEQLEIPASQAGEEHIEYEIRTQSPVDNQSSPVKVSNEMGASDESSVEKLVSFSPTPVGAVEQQQQLVRQMEALGNETACGKLSPTGGNANHDGRYYLNLLDHEKSFISKQIEQAEAILENQEAELDEDTVGKIRSAIGKANLLIKKKCNQFKDLCEANINENADEKFATLNDDLAGFWDMLGIQMSDVRKSFENLWIAKENDWKIDNGSKRDNQLKVGEEETRSSLRDKSIGKPKLSAQKDQERRERLMGHINQMKQNQASKASAENLLEDPDLKIEALGANTAIPETNTLEDQVPGDVNISMQAQEEQLLSLAGATDDIANCSYEPDLKTSDHSSGNLVNLME